MEQSDRAKQVQRQRSQRTPEEKERQRKTPVTARPARDSSGLYLHPAGRKRIGQRWSGMTGEWVEERLPIMAAEQSFYPPPPSQLFRFKSEEAGSSKISNMGE